MSIGTKVRDDLHMWLADLSALKNHVDPSSDAASAFNEAWKVALENAKKAAAEYAKVMK
jgi:hypothetical protein